MTSRLFRTALPLLALVTATSLAETAAAQPAAPKPPATAPGPPPQPKTYAGDTSIPVSATMQSLEARLALMLSGKAGLTADEVARRAEETSPEVKQKQAAVTTADSKTNQAGYQFLPRLTATARYTRLSPIDQGSLTGGTSILATDKQGLDPAQRLGTADIDGTIHAVNFSFPIFLNQYLVQAQLTVPISDYLLRLSRALGAAKQSRRASELDEKASRLKVAADARVAYYQWIRAQGQLLVADQALEQTKGHLVDAQRSFDVGMVSKADVLRATSAEKGSELLVARAQNLQALAQEQLRVTMHDAPTAKYEIGENILLPLAPFPGMEASESMHAEALEKRLEIRTLDETVFSLRETAKLQRVANLPRLDGQATAMYANPNQRLIPAQDRFVASWDASLILSWTPTDIPLTNANAAETDARAAQVEAQKASVRDGLRLEVTQAFNALKEAEVALDTTHSALVASEENYRVRRDLYRNGRSTSVDLTDAETELTRARLEAVNARIDGRIARVRLTHALGRDVK